MVPVQSEKSLRVEARLRRFMDMHVYPNEELYHRQLKEGPEQFRQVASVKVV